ncbi:MAG: hypothetical protein LBJ75_00950 [Puniceicoccales bacterium]|jgi:hypothetical protein|nr:hypothetical protein [Puniceicoccales bacterium]
MIGGVESMVLYLLAKRLRDKKSFQTERVVLGNVYIDPLLEALLNGILFDMANIELVLRASRNSKVLAVERSMRALDVQVTFADNMELAEIIMETFGRMKKGDRPLPPGVFLFRNVDVFSPGEILETRRSFGLHMPLAGIDAINSPILLEHNLVETLQLEPPERAQQFADSSPAGVIYHELGHFYHNINGIDFCKGYDIFHGACWNKDNKPTKLHRKVTNTVSFYATSDSCGCEFVAEVFAGLATGKSFDGDIMDLYRDLNGPVC